MATHEQKVGTQTDTIIDGYEQGIAASPHLGIANMQNVNLSTETKEVINSFPRVQNSMTKSAATGTLAFSDSSHVTLSIANTNNLFKGNWITVTGSSNTSQLPNGTYYVPPSTGAGFELANYYNVDTYQPTSGTVNYLIVAGGGAGGYGDGGGGGGGAGAMLTGTATASSGANTITVGAGGTLVSTPVNGGSGGNSSAFSVTATGGGGGGAGNATTGHGATGSAGGSGGGGGGSNAGASGSAGGTASTGGNIGGQGGDSYSGGGGGGASAVGASGNTTGNGGAGTASSISGASVTYAGGGGAGAFGTAGTGGAGGGGAGKSGNSAGNATAGTANTGGGGGGVNATGNSGAGGSGIVIISATIGVVNVAATTGGTHTTSGGNDIWTFTTSGTWTPVYNTITPAPILTGFTTGLTASFTLAATMGKPIAKATETYFNAGTMYNRYYILDNQNLVWVYDSQNETTYSTSDNVGWFLPDYKTTWCTNATGIAVLDGFVIVAAQSGIYGKPVAQLGATNTQTTNWTVLYDNYPWQSGSNSAHFCYVGHQGNMYITDGNYIRNIFPDSTLSKVVNGITVSVTGDNVQSLASYTIDSAQSGLPVPTSYIIPSVISGDAPFTSEDGFLPVIFFTSGALPTAINSNQIYFLKRIGVTGGSDFNVYADPSMSQQNAVNMTGNASAGATSATLTATWPYLTGIYSSTFFYSGGTEQHNVLFTNGSTAVSFQSALVHTTNSVQITAWGTLDVQTGAAGTQYYSTFYPTLSVQDPYASNPMYVTTPQRFILPNFEIAQCMAEVGNIMIIGCNGATLYPWDQISNLPSTIIPLPEGDVPTICTVNQVGVVFAGHKGNVYVSDGSGVYPLLTVPDYVAGIAGTPTSYIEPYYSFTDSMYVRGKVYFGLVDQTATKTGNAGGIWAFTPTQNMFIQQDAGTALHMENTNSYNTLNGAASILIPKVNQKAVGAQYFSGWYSDITSPSYGIDATSPTTFASVPTVIETDAIPLGTYFEKVTFQQFMYKLATPLLSTETINMNYRTNLTDAWTALGKLESETNTVSGNFNNNFQKAQWVQLQIILTPATGSSFIRFIEARLRL